MTRHLRLSAKLLLIFVFFAAGLVIGLGALAYGNGRAELQAATISRLLSTALEKQAALETWVHESQAHLALLMSTHELDEDLAAFAAAPPGSRAAGSAHDRLKAALQGWAGAGRPFTEVLLIEPLEGRVIVATNPTQEGTFKEDRPYFLGGKRGPYVQSPGYAIQLQAPTMMVSAPIVDSGGELLGVLAGRLNLVEMNAIVGRRSGLYTTDDAYLVNRAGLLVTQPRFLADAAVRPGVSTEAVKQCLARQSGVIAAADYRDVPVLSVHRWIEARDLCLIVAIDESEALAPIHAFGRTMELIGGVILLVASGLAFWLARGITRPVLALRAGAMAIAQGDLAPRLPTERNDELGDLAREFNEMAAALAEKEATLRRYTGELEHNVAMRTAEVRHQRDTYQLMLQSLSDMGQGFLIGDGPRIVYTNDAACALTGYSGEELVMLPSAVALLPPEEHAMFASWVRQLSEGRSIAGMLECTLVRKDGRRIAIEASAKAVQLDGGGQSIIIFRDVSERKQAERALREREHQLARAQQIARLGSWEWEIASNSVNWSDELYRIYGKAPGAFTPSYETFLETVHPEDRAEVQAIVERALGDHQPFAFDHRLILPDGALRVLHATGEMVLDRDGRPARMIGTAQDITERKRAEDALARQAEELARSNADLEQFAYVASHDLQEPLRMITSYAGLFNRRYQGALDDKAERYLGHIVDGATRMQQLINDLLAYSRVGRQSRQRVPVDTMLALEHVLENLRLALAESGAEITRDTLPTVLAEERDIAQLFQNLISNAIKFCRDEPPRVQISAQRDNCGWRFCVRDNGIGIDLQYAERIFVIFQRLHTRREYQGTGIGLAICQKIVERYGGRIWVESQEGQGASFYFTIPD